MAVAAYHPAMTPEQTTALNHLAAWLRSFERSGRTRREFWSEFGARAGDLEAQAFADDADPDLREAYLSVVDDAHREYGGPDDIADDVMD